MRIILSFIFLLAITFQCSPPESQILYDFEDTFDLNSFYTQKITAKIVEQEDNKVLELVLLSDEEHPTLTISAPEDSWDFSKREYLEMDIKNLSENDAIFTFWALSGAGWGGISSASNTESGREKLRPDSSKTLKIDLHGRYPGPDALATAVDPSKVKQVKIIFHIRQAGFKFQIDNIRVCGNNPIDSLGTEERFPVPEIISAEPAPGKRVRQQLPSFKDTDIAHILTLPRDWQPDKRYPVIVEYTGNVFYHKYCHSTGLTEQGNLAYGISRGENFICLNLPFISEDGLNEQVNGWGSEERTIDYCIETIRYVCENYGGDPSAVILTGFSRGEIGCNYIALRDDRIADVWLAFLGNPEKVFPEGKEGWKGSGIGWNERRKRIKDRSCFLKRPNLGPAHVDIQYLEDSEATIASRQWLKQVIKDRPGTYSISGRVSDKMGQGLAGVRIQSGPIHYTFTDENGHYELKSLIKGKRVVLAKRNGLSFYPSKYRVTITEQNLTNIDFIN